MNGTQGIKPETGWSSIALIAVMLLTVAWSIQTAGWVDGLDVLTMAVLGAVAVGLVLSRLDWMPGLLAHGWGLILGLAWTTFLGTRILTQYNPPEGYAAFSTVDRMAVVRDRLVLWLMTARTGAPVDADTSGLVFVLATALLLWLLSYVCVRFLVRYVSFWGAVMPAGFALLANLYYAPDTPPTYLALFLLCALLLAVKTSVAINEDYWRRARVHFSPDIGLDFLKDGVMVAVAVIGLGYLAPAEIRSAQLTSVVTSVTGSSGAFQSQFNRLFPNLNYPNRGSGGGYADEMPLTGSIDLAVVPIFDVRVEGAQVPRYYRMAVFDSYDGTGWRRSSSREAAADDVLADSVQASVPVTQTFENFQKGTAQLYVAPEPGSLSLPARAIVAGPEDSPDVLQLEPTEPLDVGSTFTAVSHKSVATVSQLRSAPVDDPGWITERYTALPTSDDLDLVAAKAREVTAGADNRFDTATQIEDYLRRFPYSETIDDPPADRDRVAWFLFQEQKGYCDYYSSAFVVMARSLGIPARVAAGYSLGSYSPDSGAFRQHAFDAHSWPEVYFADYGWIQFEPTAQDSKIARAEGTGAQDDASLNASAPPRDDMLPDDKTQDLPQPDAATEGGTLGPAGGGLVGLAMRLLGALGVVVAAAVGARFAWERQFRGLTPAQSAFTRLVRLAGWIGVKPRSHDTPYEYRARLTRVVPDAETHIDTITDAYVKERFAEASAPEDPTVLRRAWVGARASLARLAARSGVRRLLRRRPRE